MVAELVSAFTLPYLHRGAEFSSTALARPPSAGGRVSPPALMALGSDHLHPCLQSQLHCAAQTRCGLTVLSSAAACDWLDQLSCSHILQMAQVCLCHQSQLQCVAQARCRFPSPECWHWSETGQALQRAASSEGQDQLCTAPRHPSWSLTDAPTRAIPMFSSG